MMRYKPYTIMVKRNWFGTTVGNWLAVIDNESPTFSPLIAGSPEDAVLTCAALDDDVYYLAHNESGRPEYGYVMPSGKVRAL